MRSLTKRLLLCLLGIVLVASATVLFFGDGKQNVQAESISYEIPTEFIQQEEGDGFEVLEGASVRISTEAIKFTCTVTKGYYNSLIEDGGNVMFFAVVKAVNGKKEMSLPFVNQPVFDKNDSDSKEYYLYSYLNFENVDESIFETALATHFEVHTYAVVEKDGVKNYYRAHRPDRNDRSMRAVANAAYLNYDESHGYDKEDLIKYFEEAARSEEIYGYTIEGDTLVFSMPSHKDKAKDKQTYIVYIDATPYEVTYNAASGKYKVKLADKEFKKDKDKHISIFDEDDKVHSGKISNSAEQVSDLVFAPINKDTEYSVVGYNDQFTGRAVIPATYNDKKVTSIAPYTFAGVCSSLTFEEGSNIKTIGEYAFLDCERMRSITIPASVEYIGDWAFLDCFALGTVRFEEGTAIKSMGQYTFMGCDNLNYATDGGSSYLGSAENEYFYLAKASTDISSATINSNCEIIGSFAFFDIPSLTSVEIPASVTAICMMAFSESEELTNVTIAQDSQLERICDQAFEGCENLNHFVVPETVTFIGFCAFYYCNNLTIFCEAKSQPEDWYREWNCTEFNLFEYAPVYWGNEWEYVDGVPTARKPYTEGLEFIRVDESYHVSAYSGTSTLVIIPSTHSGLPVTGIGYEAFRSTIAKQLVIPSSVTYTGFDAFWRNDDLTIYLEAEELPNWDFYDCTVYCADEWEYVDGVPTLKGQTPEWEGLVFELNDEETEYSVTGYTGTNTELFIPQYYKGLPVVAINHGVFDSNYDLQSITIPKTVKLIDTDAFWECRNLKKVIFEQGSELQEIGMAAFNSCRSLETIIIPANVTVIGRVAFSGCDSLTIFSEVGSQPSGWEEDWNYSNRPVYWSGEWEYVDGVPTVKGAVNPDPEEPYTEGLVFELNSEETEYAVTGYTGAATEVIIPSTYSGLPVTSIADWAFENHDAITSVKISTSIVSIGNMAFKGCTSLTSIEIPNNVTSIGMFAFEDCAAEIKWGDNPSITELGESAFGNYKGTIIEVPNSVTSLGKYVFEGCSVEIEWGTNPSITKLTDCAFTNYLGSIIIVPSSVQEISSSAFWDCTNLISVVIPSSVVIIEGYALDTNSDLTIFCEAQSQPSSWANDWNCTNCPVYWSGEWEYVDGVPTAKLPVDPEPEPEEPYTEGLVFTLNNAGTEYSVTDYTGTATEVVIPSTYKGLPVTCLDYAFSQCGSITSVEIPNSVTIIGDYAFYGCSLMTSIEIPDSVTSIGYYAFYDCDSLTSVTIGDSVTIIGDSAFRNCNSLTSIVIPNNVTSIYYGAFFGCSNLTSVTIGNGVTSLGGYVFYECTSLTSVTIGNSVTSIGDFAFADCISLTSVEISGSVTSIGDFAFGGCSNLTSVTIKEGVESIGEGAFYGCSSLTSIAIPSDLVSIGSMAFVGCDSLSNIYITDLSAWLNIPNVYNLMNYGAEIKIIYLNNKPLTELIIPDGVTVIWSSAFRGCVSLTSVAIPDSVTNIYNNPFYGCTSLKYNVKDGLKYLGNSKNPYLYLAGVVDTSVVAVDIDSNCRIIGSYAFEQCENLTSITIPDSVTSIGVYAFYNCTSLASIEIPNSVTSIGTYAFYNCRALESIVIPHSVTEITGSLFGGAYSLKAIYVEVDLEAEGWPIGWIREAFNSADATIYWAGEWEYVDGVPTVKGETPDVPSKEVQANFDASTFFDELGGAI